MYWLNMTVICQKNYFRLVSTVSKLDPIFNCHQIDSKNTQNYGAFSNKRLFKEN